MSDPASPSQPKPPTDPKAGLIVVAAAQLVPLFRTGCTDFRAAHKMALSAIATYHPESRADYINIARTIAFSMAALALLSKVATADMPIPDLMRIYGRANALNRSADQSERTMISRRAYHAANPPAELPAWMDPSLEEPEPDASTDAALVQAAVAEAMREYAAAVRPPQTESPPSANAVPTSSDPAARPTEPAPAATTPATAIRYANQGTSLPLSRQSPGTGQPDQPRAAPYKTTLLRNTAMPPAVTRSPDERDRLKA